MKPFPTAVAAIFLVLAMISVAVFATYSARKDNAVGEVLIWGPIPDSVMDQTLVAIQEKSGSFSDVSYQFVREEELMPTLITAIASGRGPDLVVFPASHLMAEKDKLIVIPYDSYSKRQFQDAFIEAGEIFLGAQGSYGLPFALDPLVMYWNRGLFAEAGIATPPKYWDELSTLAPQLSKYDARGTLHQSAVALGTWQNVHLAKDIFVSILNQLGNRLVVPDKDGYRSTLAGDSGTLNSGDSTLRFYTDFADPVKPVYSWNSSQPDSRDAFVAGQLAVYFGRASELSGIRQANPNLNFDVAVLPSARGGGTGAAAALYGLSVPRGSRNTKGALTVALALTAPEVEAILGKSLSLPSVLRDYAPESADDPYAGIFRNAALTAFVLRDPDPTATDSIFKRMVESVSSGSRNVSAAVSSADDELSALLGVQ